VYGSRRISDALSKLTIKAGRYKVRRLLADLELKVRYPKKVKVTTDSDHHDAISPNKLDRQFMAKTPNKVCFHGKWLAERLTIICIPRFVSMLCRWLFGAENQSLGYCIIRIVAANMQTKNIVIT